jgi:hypothetical protein
MKIDPLLLVILCVCGLVLILMLCVLPLLSPFLIISSPFRFIFGGGGSGNNNGINIPDGFNIPNGVADGRLPSSEYYGPKIENIPPYQPQSICDPTPKPGVVAFKNMILKIFPQTGNDGISRDCGVSPDGLTVSEHYEGRAWDWQVSANNPNDVKAVQSVLDWLLATDKYGNTYAMARRLGIMYIIWNHHIWSMNRANEGWRIYTSTSNPHTDHVHFSFYWDGALEKTTFWHPELSCPQPATPTVASACG